MKPRQVSTSHGGRRPKSPEAELKLGGRAWEDSVSLAGPSTSLSKKANNSNRSVEQPSSINILSQSLLGFSEAEFSTGLKNLDRPQTAPIEKFPKHVVPSITDGQAGITFSAENQDSSKDVGLAELEVLKCILNREEYMKKLLRAVRTIDKKFKPEIADFIDIIRISSVDVIEAIVNWRELKVSRILMSVPSVCNNERYRMIMTPYLLGTKSITY